MNFHDMYSKRHDRLVNHIHQQITAFQPNWTVYNNQIVTAEMFNSESNELYSHLEHRKPDLIAIDHRNRKVFIVMKFLVHLMLLLINATKPSLIITCH